MLADLTFRRAVESTAARRRHELSHTAPTRRRGDAPYPDRPPGV